MLRCFVLPTGYHHLDVREAVTMIKDSIKHYKPLRCRILETCQKYIKRKVNIRELQYFYHILRSKRKADVSEIVLSMISVRRSVE